MIRGLYTRLPATKISVKSTAGQPELNRRPDKLASAGLSVASTVCSGRKTRCLCLVAALTPLLGLGMPGAVQRSAAGPAALRSAIQCWTPAAGAGVQGQLAFHSQAEAECTRRVARHLPRRSPGAFGAGGDADVALSLVRGRALLVNLGLSP